MKFAIIVLLAPAAIALMPFASRAQELTPTPAPIYQPNGPQDQFELNGDRAADAREDKNFPPDPAAALARHLAHTEARLTAARAQLKTEKEARAKAEAAAATLAQRPAACPPPSPPAKPPVRPQRK
jgi:hypothetical protein